nr:unnamed protein product [Callosobruchus chinensis]
MNTEALKAVQCRESDLVTKKETDPNRDVASNRIKVELSGDHSDDCKLDNQEAIELVAKNKCAISGNIGKFQATGAIEQLFFKSENDQITEDMTVLSRIKSEVIDWDEFDAVNVGNAEELAVNMDSEVKEELIVESEKGKNPYIITETDLKRIKKECSENYSDEYAAHDFQIAAVEPETDMDSGEYKVTEITEECNIKTDSETSMDAVEDIASNSMGKSIIAKNQLQVETKKAGRELFSCYNCNHTVNSKDDLISHMKVHCIQRNVHLTTQDDTLNKIDNCKPTLWHLKKAGSARSNKLSTCIHCDAIFKSNGALDDHIIRKHPDFVTSIARKIYECTECSYKTSVKNNFNKHFSLVHSETGSSKSLLPCNQCNAKFKNKASLDNHVVKKHPNSIMSVTNKIYECTECIYKTTFKNNFYRHLSVHPQTASYSERNVCIQCNASLNSKTALNDHIVRKHPNLAGSVTTNIFECPQCTFRTIRKGYLNKHMLTHSKTMSHYKLSVCIHCKATFKKKAWLNDHIIKKHPDSATSVDSAVYECTSCTYKTTFRKHIERHISVHSETRSICKLSTCCHCVATFKSERGLDAHVVEKHPEFITSVSRKIHECKICSYKTIYSTSFNNHMSTHPETASGYELSPCVHCNATFKKKSALDEHVLKKHPSFFEASCKKIYECSRCDFKTTVKRGLDRHTSSSVHCN